MTIETLFARRDAIRSLTLSSMSFFTAAIFAKASCEACPPSPRGMEYAYPRVPCTMGM